MKYHLGALLALAVLTPAAEAEIVTWRASGLLTNQLALPIGAGGAGLPGTIDIFLTFDATAPDRDADPTRGVYANLLAVGISINGAPLSALNQSVTGWPGDFIPDAATSALIVHDDALAGGLFAEAIEVVATDRHLYGDDGPEAEFPLNSLSLLLARESAAPGALLSSDAIPGTPPDPQAFETHRLAISGWFSPGQQYWYEASIHSLAPVPLPAAAWLMLSALGLLRATARARESRLSISPPHDAAGPGST